MMVAYLNFYSNKRIFKRSLFFAALFLITFVCIKLKLDSSNRLIKNEAKFLLNLEDFYYIIQNEICFEEIFLLILIHSAPNHFHLRNSIRNTWGQPEIKSVNVKVVFLLAASPKFQMGIEEENDLHNDIIQGNFIDSYRNLTYKHIMGLQWASENCPQAKYLMKMDDDIFINMYQFIEYINTHFTPSMLRNNIACYLFSGMVVIRDPVNKWYVTKTEYSSDVYVNFCSGWAYLTTTTTAYHLVHTANQLNYFWVDDVHVTGTAAKAANIRHIKMNELFEFAPQGLVDWSNNSINLHWNKMFAPTFGDLELSKRAYRKSLKCYVMQCKCCYIKKTTPHPTQPSTTRKGIVKSIYK